MLVNFNVSISYLCHKLMIERGRWLKVPRTDRLCVCCNKLEDEFHVICECPRYSCISPCPAEYLEVFFKDIFF